MKTREHFMTLYESIDFEKIIDHPNILIAASFWDAERYRAARVCYKFMRKLDDLIDDYKAEHRGIAEADRSVFEADVKQWLQLLKQNGRNAMADNELAAVIECFRLPVWALEDFAVSMMYDISHDGFATLDDFIRYSGGASVAPASIFVHLAGLQESDGKYSDPPFNVRQTASPCAMFSYFVHIMRDFRKDQLNNLSYFADEIMARHGLTRADLREMALGAPLNSGFREMMREYQKVADSYRLNTLNIMHEICPLLEPRYRLSLEIIFELYLMVFERIDPEKGLFTTEELNPTPAETRVRVRKVIEKI
jgi:phytoene/squalene synthetase